MFDRRKKMRKTRVFGIRMTDEERRNLEREAKKNGMTLSAYIRHLSTLRADIKMTIKELRSR